MAKHRQNKKKKWGVLTRRDLRRFDDSATEAVLYAMARGAVGRISSNGHAILRNSEGETTSVTPNSNRSKQVVSINVRKLFGGDDS